MQTIEKALHQPMPFTTGGQTISDRLTAAKHSLAGSQLGKTICKATTEEVMAPKKKHLDYLLHCTNEPNVSIPSMANLLIERTQHPNWTVVYKSLITIHNIMCYGNERFSQYLASCNTTFNLGTFLDKNSATVPGYDMSNHVRRYGKYIGEKIATYRVCAFDFCKVKRGREDGLLRTMHTDKLLKTLPILQNQIDALLEFSVTSSELNNGVINCSFILLFRDLIRLFACYNDGIINVLEKYFDMNKKQCRDALDTYKAFLTRLDKVAEFLRIAESVGIDRGEIPDLTRAPASLLEALEAHLIHLEGGKAPPPSQMSAAHHQLTNFSMVHQPAVADSDRQRYIELENERLRQFEAQKKQAQVSSQNPFASETAAPPAPNNDLLDFFQAPAVSQASNSDANNPFAHFSSQPTYANTPAPTSNPHAALPYGGQPFYAATSNGAVVSCFPTVVAVFVLTLVAENIRRGLDENPFLTSSEQHQPAPPVPPPPTAAAISEAHSHSSSPAVFNPFAEQLQNAPPPSSAPFNPQGAPAPFGGYGIPNDVDNGMSRMSISNNPGTNNAWSNGAPAASAAASTMNNPFAMAGQPGMYTAPVGGYHPQMGGFPIQQQQPQQQPPMWNPIANYPQPFQFAHPGHIPYHSQQQQVQLVHQAAAAQQQAQANQQLPKDPFGS
ncbi:unnamed protein product [Caenorhabditis auriculariae]|uniref:ENTH domain-containing protein n=1 Tax=Caenorhabditis auriculariae TaxID=2777116 RepID=A0A8S1H5B6_9PELO|nr:unnamed protein product [Caenorhabditis auriculariae]